MVLPSEDDGGDIVPMGGDGIRRAVSDVKKWRQKREPACCPAQGTRLASLNAANFGSIHDRIRSATDTVKIPHSSTRWSIFLKPAASTS